jgi:hypothetical protein
VEEVKRVFMTKEAIKEASTATTTCHHLSERERGIGQSKIQIGIRALFLRVK